jgi:hypothetical protein
MVTALVSNSASADWGFSMGKQESVKAKAVAEATALAAGGPETTPKMALASLERLNAEASERAAALEMAPVRSTGIPKIGLAKIDGPTIAQPELPLERRPEELISDERSDQYPNSEQSSPQSDSTESDGADPLVADDNSPAPAVETPAPRVNRFTMLAACLALAAALGGMVGALTAFSLARPQTAPVITAGKFSPEEIQTLKENVVQARVELAALKASVDAGNRGASTQFTKITERIERMERNAAEPAARLNKAVESIERIARAEGAALKDVTASIAPREAAKPSVLEGWVLRDVHRGTAFLEGRNGIIEVEQGDLVPGLGRIDAIRKQDGRWVVVTSKGTIAATPR